jgi:AAA+ ATPase superfamily predicted ATPase
MSYHLRVALDDPSWFHGRRDELNRLFSYLNKPHPQNVSIVGPNCIGKTWLLQVVAQDKKLQAQHLDEPSVYTFVYWSLMEGESLLARHFHRALIRLLLRNLPSDLASSCREEIDKRDLEDSFARMVDVLEVAQQRVILLLDDFDALACGAEFTPSFFSHLRSILSRPAVACVTASNRSLGEVGRAGPGSPFFNVFSRIQLGLLSEEEAGGFIARSLSDAGLRVEPGLVREVFELTGPHPWFINQLCYILADEVGTSRTVTREDLRQLGRDFQIAASGVLAHYMQQLDDDELTLLRSIAEGDQPNTLDSPSYLRLKASSLVVEREGNAAPFSALFGQFAKRGHSEDSDVEQVLSSTVDESRLKLTAATTWAAFEPIRPNPYITGVAVNTPDMFFGRQDILDFLKDNLIGTHQSNIIILQGNRRTGKSSILKQAVNTDLFAPHVGTYIDCQGFGELSNQSFFYRLAREIRRELSKRRDMAALPAVRREDISEVDPFDDFREVLDRLISHLQGRQLILLIDEFESIGRAVDQGKLTLAVPENLRHLLQHHGDLAAVISGSYRLLHLRNECWSVFLSTGLKKKVGFLDEDAARDLIIEPLSGSATYSPGAVERILELTSRQPYFLQVICHNAVNTLNSIKSTTVTRGVVEDAAQEALVSAEDHMRSMFRSAESAVGRAVLVYMASSLPRPGTLSGVEIEQFIAQHHLKVSDGELLNTLRGLAERDVVQIDGSVAHRQYGFRIDLLRQWIRRNYDLKLAVALAQESS